MRRILVYGDTNLNARDGSSVWLSSIAQVLAQTGSKVFLLLKADVQEERRLVPIRNAGVTILSPYEDRKSGGAGLPARIAARRIVALDRRYDFHIVLSRGFDISSHLAVSGKFTGRLWPYLTEGPAFKFQKTEHEKNLLTRIGDEARRVFTQTEEARSILEANMPTATGKTLLMNPMIPDSAFVLGAERLDREQTRGTLSLVYAGKFARLWNTLEMPELPELLRSHGVDSHLHMIGDKFNLTNNDYPWLHAMRAAAAQDSADVTWHGGLSREDTLLRIASADIGISWRDRELDASPEVSTKMLEYAALGTPPVLNRSSLHEQLLGDSYPLFVEGTNITEPLVKAAQDPHTLKVARHEAFRMAQQFSMASTVQNFRTYFERAEGHSGIRLSRWSNKRPLRVVIAGHDFKFAADLMEMLRQRDDVELRIDKWRRLASHDEAQSRMLGEWADTIICEWAGPNAVFYSKNRKSHQKLFVRFHGFEKRGSWLKDIKIDNVDGFVFVSDFYRREVVHSTGWPEHKTTVIYNTVDQVDLYRPKVSGAQFNIGLAGYVPMLKRPDRGIALLRLLLEADDRFYLRIRGREPWNYPWEWNKPIQQDAYRAFFASIAEDPFLRSHVIFEKFGPDMGSWFRKIGWMISPSTRETFHLAPVEGMMSGAVPVVWQREGADEIFGSSFVHEDTASAAAFILDNLEPQAYSSLQRRSLDHGARYEMLEARKQWMRLLALDKRGPLEMNGISILEGVTIPTNQAEAVASFYKVFYRDGFQVAYAETQPHMHLLEPDFRKQLHQAAILESWIEDPQRILPSSSLSPLYLPIPGSVLSVGKATTSDAARNSVHEIHPSITGDFYSDVNIVADHVTREARRERPEKITASGLLSICFGALVAARHLGIPFVRGAVEAECSGAPTYLEATIEKLLHLFDSETKAPPAQGDMHPASELEIKSLSAFKIGLIADEFTRDTISEEVQTVHIEPHCWRTQIDGLDAVIIESAWEGMGRGWFQSVAYHGDEKSQNLWSLIRACQMKKIPTIFWNKEDPVHFRSFQQTAGKCDHVFTTDANMIPHYLKSEFNNSQTVASLSFFAQPKKHHPLSGDFPWKGTVAFAGTYYGQRYEKRSEELSNILDVAVPKGLTIYDRQHDKPDSPYKFPSKYRNFSSGSLSYEQMLQSYKSHPVHINVNSVSNSPSMFSRRVVEIAASGSLVLSGRGQGISEALGDAFPVLDSKAQWEEYLNLALTDEAWRLRAISAQRRTVLRSHRSDQAIALMLRVAGLNVNPRSLPLVAWYADSNEVVQWASEQTWRPLIVPKNNSVRRTAEKLGLGVFHEDTHLSQERIYVGKPTRKPYKEWCEDMMYTTLVVEADCLSVVSTCSSRTPLLQQGLGDEKLALWDYRLDDISNARKPYKLRVDGVTAVKGQTEYA